MSRTDIQPAPDATRYKRGDSVRVRVTDRETGRSVANYTEKVDRVDGSTCTTRDGNVWDSLTGASIGWLATDLRAVIMLEQYAETVPSPRKATKCSR